MIDCDICETKINLRAQIGYFNIPFNLHCPECKTHIYGQILIDQDEIEIKLKLENAQTINNEVNSGKTYYCAELSAEFPTIKMYKKDTNSYELSPFIRNATFYGDSSKAMRATSNAMKFATYFNIRWKQLKVYFELFWNDQNSLLYPKLEEELKNYDFITFSKVTNKLNANMALHQLFMTTTPLASALQPNTLNFYMDIASLMLQLDTKEIQKFIHTISSDFNSIERKAFNLIESFSGIYDQLIPVVALRNSDSLGNLDKEKYGIMTTNFEQLSDFYAKSYEWILDNINIIIALNNILIRKNYNICANNKPYNEILKIGSKYKKLEYIEPHEQFSTPTNSLQNRIRNSIQHFDTDIDYVSQEIIFTDSHRGRIRYENMYLIDFADLCLENFSIIIYLLELIYNLRRIFYISNGIIPNLTPKNSELNNKKTTKKIGRNDPCFCGSGKKYKKCCLP